MHSLPRTSRSSLSNAVIFTVFRTDGWLETELISFFKFGNPNLFSRFFQQRFVILFLINEKEMRD